MLQPGTQVGGYLIESVLGHGGMSVVYEARQVALDRKVAFKLLAPHLAADADFRERFRHEGRLQATLDHPHIVTVYEAGEIREGLYLAMRLIRGATLKDMAIARELDGARTIKLLEPIADALDTAHEAGLIHRDIKPQNILVDRRDHAYLADFGLMKGAGSQGMTRAGQVVGTVDYISPEQIRGEEATPASDVYSFAAVLYEGFTGAIPYVRGSDASVMYAHVNDAPPRVTDQRPDLPRTLDAVIARGMAKDAGERYASAGELIESARDALGSGVRAIITPPEPITSPEQVGFRPPSPTIVTAEPAEPSPPDNGAAPEVPAEDEQVEPEFATVAEAPVAEDEATPAPEPQAVGATVISPPAETVLAPEETVIATGEDVMAPDDAIAADEDVMSPDETVISPRETVMSRGETVISPGATVISPGATVISPGETVISPGETVVSQPAPERRDEAEPPSRRRRSVPLVPLTIAAAAVAAVIGYVAGRPSDDPPAPARTIQSVAAETPSVALERPADWRVSSASPVVPGLPVTDSVSFGPGDASAAGIMAGRVTTAVGGSLLPAGFVHRVTGTLPEGEPVEIGAAAGLRYRDLAVDGFGDRRVSLYVVPTTAGVATAACYSSPTAKLSAADCERVVGTLEPRRGDALPLGADPNYAETLNAAIADIGKTRRNLRARLRAAKTFKAQATAADKLADSHRAAAKSVSEQNATPAVAEAQDDLAAALRDSADAYAALARATRRHQEKAYDKASKDVTAADSDLTRAIKSFAAAGYQVR